MPEPNFQTGSLYTCKAAWCRAMVKHAPHRVRFTGGEGRRGPRDGTTPTGRVRSSPRWSPAAAASAYRVIQSTAARQGTPSTIFVAKAFVEDASWKLLTRAVASTAVPALQRSCVLAVLEHHREKARSIQHAGRRAAAESFYRAVRRRAAECPELPTIGVPTAGVMRPSSFHAWIDTVLPADAAVRKTPASSTETGPFGFWNRWKMSRVEHDGVICFARAGDRVRTWRNDTGAESDAPPPIQLARALVHPTVLPTAMAAKQDQYWLPRLGRYMAVHEVTRAFGLRDDSPLTKVLCANKRPASAVQLLGRAIHAGVAHALLQTLDRDGLLPANLTYASACSGIDTFAEAVDMIRPGAWVYSHAAESEAAQRAVFTSAWGLSEEDIFHDAQHAGQGALVDLYAVSPDCANFSRRNHSRDVGAIADGATDASAVLAFVKERRAAVVVIENVDEVDGVAAITTVLLGIGGYTWREQKLNPGEHAGAPVARERHFWVGVREAEVLMGVAV